MQNKVIDTLLTRQSVKFVQAPGPDAKELELIFQAAVRAPDHGKVRPWRFAIIRGENIPKLMDLGIKAAINAGKPIAENKIEKNRRWLDKVPLVIAIACAPDATGYIREEESKLSVAMAVMNMQTAAQSLGYHAYWSTGIGTYYDGVGEALGFDALDYHFMGYLSIGTPIETPEPKVRPDYKDFVRELDKLIV